MKNALDGINSKTLESFGQTIRLSILSTGSSLLLCFQLRTGACQLIRLKWNRAEHHSLIIINSQVHNQNKLKGQMLNTNTKNGENTKIFP